MAETHRKNPIEGLNATLAGGPFFLGLGARKESALHHVDFVRVSFHFLARALRAVRRISGLTTSLGRSFQGLVEPRAVWAGVAETHRKNPLVA